MCGAASPGLSMWAAGSRRGARVLRACVAQGQGRTGGPLRLRCGFAVRVRTAFCSVPVQASSLRVPPPRHDYDVARRTGNRDWDRDGDGRAQLCRRVDSRRKRQQRKEESRGESRVWEAPCSIYFGKPCSFNAIHQCWRDPGIGICLS